MSSKKQSGKSAKIKPFDADVAVQNAQDETEIEQEQTEQAQESSSTADELNAKIADLEQQLCDAKNSFLRLQADFDNNRKRNAQLRTESLSAGKVSAIVEFLKVVDNFERGLQIPCADEGYANGMKMIYKMSLETLTNLGVEEIDTSGTFDPNFHEAVMQDEVEGKESGTITEVLQKGYMFNGKVIRTAMVKVAK